MMIRTVLTARRMIPQRPMNLGRDAVAWSGTEKDVFYFDEKGPLLLCMNDAEVFIETYLEGFCSALP